MLQSIVGFFSKLGNKGASENQKISENTLRSTHDPSFIPYACYYNRETILCKDAQLIQSMEIIGFGATDGLREALRSAIKDVAGNEEISIWVHSIRLKEGFRFPSNSHGDFSEELHNAMCGNKKYEIEFINKLYITISMCRIRQRYLSLSGLNMLLTKITYRKLLESNAHKLQQVVAKILTELEKFKPKILTIAEDGTSNLLDFLYFLTHCSKTPQGVVPFSDLSEHLMQGTRYKFGFNAFSIQTEDEQTKFCNTLTLKDGGDIPSEVLDGFMQINSEFIVSEVINFAGSKKQLEFMKYQKYLLEISADQELAQSLKLDDDNLNCVCNHSVVIVPVASNLFDLEESTEKIVSTLASKGIQLVRDDLSMEQKFWFILPGNRSFLWRMSLKNIQTTCSFAGLQHFPTGNIDRSFAVFWSIFQMPYLFGFATATSFRENALILGTTNSGRTILQNFLISEARTVSQKILILDNQQKSHIFVRSIRGKYKLLMGEGNDMQCFFNPTNAIDSNGNATSWSDVLKSMSISCEGLVEPEIGLRTVQEKVGPLGKIFSETSSWNESQIIGIDIAPIQSLGELKAPISKMLIESLMHDFSKMLGAIILIEEPWVFFKEFFSDAKNIETFFNKAKEFGIKIIFSGEDHSWAENLTFLQCFQEIFNSFLILPGFRLNSDVAKMFDFSTEDLVLLRSLRSYERHFFLKQEKNNAVLKLDFMGMKEVYVLSSNFRSITNMAAAMENTDSEDPKMWLPKFYDKCLAKT